MSSGSQQQGFAIALLLWMIAGMSLMVAAVIHFARDDTGMAELRLKEAKSRVSKCVIFIIFLRHMQNGFQDGRHFYKKLSEIILVNVIINFCLNHCQEKTFLKNGQS